MIPPFVTIFADASFSADTRRAGWGCWITGPLGALERGAAFRTFPPDSTTAELMALANALHLAYGRALIPCRATVMLQSDCASALSLLVGMAGARDRPAAGGLPIERGSAKSEKSKNQVQASIRVVEHIQKTLEITILVRHVPGHRTGGGRAWVNRLVDGLARQGAGLPP